MRLAGEFDAIDGARPRRAQRGWHEAPPPPPKHDYIVEALRGPAPCDECRFAVRCRDELLACSRFALYATGVGETRWRPAPVHDLGRARFETLFGRVRARRYANGGQSEGAAMKYPESATRLREAIEHRGLSHKEVAERIGVPQQTFSNWVRGISTPRGPAMAALARVLDVSFAELSGESAATAADSSSPDTLELVEALERLGPEFRKPIKALIRAAASAERRARVKP